MALALREFWSARQGPVPLPVLVGALAAGVVGGAVLVGHRAGLGLAVLGLLVWAAALPVLVRRRSVSDAVTAALSIALVAMVAVRDAEWVAALSVLTAVVVAAVAVTSARSAPAVVLSPVAGAAGVLRVLPWFRGAAGQQLGTLLGTQRSRLLGAARSVLVTVALLVVFGLLFASADQVFASYLPRFEIELDLLPARVVVGVLVALAAAAMAHLALAPPRWTGIALAPGRPAKRGEWLLPVLALDALVLAFVLVQVGALLGGHRYVLETAGLTYAEYARQGFAQLLAATALTLVVVAVAARRAPRETGRDRLLTRIALGLLCVGTLGVVASALRRMDLYVDAFGLTRLRVFAVVVELVLAAVLVLVMVAGVRWRSGWLPRAVVQVVAVAMLGLALLNPDAQIVRHNATADLSAAGTDVLYLQDLSADAVPAMDALDEPLRSCLLARARVDAPTGPIEWNLGRDRATTVLTGAELVETRGSCAEAAGGPRAIRR